MTYRTILAAISLIVSISAKASIQEYVTEQSTSFNLFSNSEGYLSVPGSNIDKFYIKSGNISMLPGGSDNIIVSIGDQEISMHSMRGGSYFVFKHGGVKYKFTCKSFNVYLATPGGNHLSFEVTIQE